MKRIIVLFAIMFSLAACSGDNSGSIFGTASADGGNITSGITVKLYTIEAELHTTTTTDGQGNFRFDGISEGNYYIGATVTSGGVTYDTGTTQQVVYVNDAIEKQVALTLNKR